jgi:hypothetical protein
MPTVYVAEFATVGGISKFGVAGAQLPPIREQTVAIGGASVATTLPFSANTTFVRVHTDAICSIAFGAAPEATVSMLRMAANQTEYFAVPKGLNYKVAVITNT